MNETTYEAYIFCQNCHIHKKIIFPKGSMIEHSECPNCGNLTLQIDPNGHLFDRPNKPINFR